MFGFNESLRDRPVTMLYLVSFNLFISVPWEYRHSCITCVLENRRQLWLRLNLNRVYIRAGLRLTFCIRITPLLACDDEKGAGAKEAEKKRNNHKIQLKMSVSIHNTDEAVSSLS